MYSCYVVYIICAYTVAGCLQYIYICISIYIYRYMKLIVYIIFTPPFCTCIYIYMYVHINVGTYSRTCFLADNCDPETFPQDGMFVTSCQSIYFFRYICHKSNNKYLKQKHIQPSFLNQQKLRKIIPYEILLFDGSIWISQPQISILFLASILIFQHFSWLPWPFERRRSLRFMPQRFQLTQKDQPQGQRRSWRVWGGFCAAQTIRKTDGYD